MATPCTQSQCVDQGVAPSHIVAGTLVAYFEARKQRICITRIGSEVMHLDIGQSQRLRALVSSKVPQEALEALNVVLRGSQKGRL